MFVTIGGLRGSLSLVLAETVATMVTEDDSLVVMVRGGVRLGEVSRFQQIHSGEVER